MLYEFIITFEIIGAIFMLFGLIPFKTDDAKNAYLNKIVCFILAATIFLSLSVSGIQAEKQICYTSSSEVVGDVTTYTESCRLESNEDIGLGAFNFGLGIVSSVLGLISMLLAGFSTFGKSDM